LQGKNNLAYWSHSRRKGSIANTAPNLYINFLIILLSQKTQNNFILSCYFITSTPTRFYTWLDVCLSICSIRLCVCPVHPSVCLLVRQTHPSVHRSICLSVCISISLLVCYSFYQAINLFACLSVYLFVCKSIICMFISVCRSISSFVYLSSVCLLFAMSSFSFYKNKFNFLSPLPTNYPCQTRLSLFCLDWSAKLT
jgi:hypothetical protein